MLNEYQRRGLSITLRIVEESLTDIEHILNSGNITGVLYEVRYNIPSAVKDEVLRKASLIRDRLKIMAERFDLEKEYTDASREALGKLPYCWEILEDAKAMRLKRYGEVAEGLGDVLDPQLNIIIDLILEMEHLLRGILR